MKYRTTKKQVDEILNCHIGVGFITYKLNDNTIREIDFFLNKDNIPCYIKSGTPVVWEKEE